MAWVDFREVKRQVSITDVLRKYGVHLKRVNGHALRGKCPLPTHSSKGSPLSFCVDTAKNVWCCRSDSCVAGRNGKEGGNVIDLVAVMDGSSIREAAEKLQSWFVVAAPSKEDKGEVPPTPQRVAEETEGHTENKPLAFTLKDVDPVHPYLQSRGIPLVTLDEFGVGFFPGKGSMQGRIVIPVHNEQGELVAYCGRAASDDAEERYRFPSGFLKTLEVFNIHRITTDWAVVVEGFFPAIKLYSFGYPAVALMGSSMSETQERILGRFWRILVMMDGDDAGRKAMHDVIPRLSKQSWVRGVWLDDGKQPDHLSKEELERLLRGLC